MVMGLIILTLTDFFFMVHYHVIHIMTENGQEDRGVAKKSGKLLQGAGSTGPQGKRHGYWLWILVAVLAAAALALGYRSLGPPSSNKVPGKSNTLSLREPPLPRSGFTWKYQAYALNSGKPAVLVPGHRITVVVLMASWCLYCAYVDRYVLPSLLHTPGIQINVVDVSPNSGIGDPGPKTPAFSGKDHMGPAVSVTGMRQVMNTYVKKFGLRQPNVHVFVDPRGINYWNVQYFPTILFVTAKGRPLRINGGITPAQAQSYLRQELGKG